VVIADEHCWKARWPTVPYRLEFGGIPLLWSMDWLLNCRQVMVVGDFIATAVDEHEVYRDRKILRPRNVPVVDVVGAHQAGPRDILLGHIEDPIDLWLSAVPESERLAGEGRD
jgi:hypothetical protein